MPLYARPVDTSCNQQVRVVMMHHGSWFSTTHTNTNTNTTVPTIDSSGPCPDAGPVFDGLSPGFAAIRMRHGAAPLKPSPKLMALAEQQLRDQRACSTSTNPAPYYNSTSGIVGVGYSALGTPAARSYKCIQVCCMVIVFVCVFFVVVLRVFTLYEVVLHVFTLFVIILCTANTLVRE